MSSDSPDTVVIKRRRPWPLMGLLSGAIVIAAGLYFIERELPAFHDIIFPFYVIILIVAAIGTWRLVRARSPKDRRHGDRRSVDRRDEEP